MMKYLGRAAFACAAIIIGALAATEREASAWYFPEHVVVATDAVTQLPPEIRAVLATAIAQARVSGLPLCEKVEVGLVDVERHRPIATRMMRAEKGVDCIPYTALSALGGDHSNDAPELRAVLTTTGKAFEVVTAAVEQWHRFLSAVDQLPNTPIERMAFVHALDVDFYYIDPGYEVRASMSRAHFVDAGRSIEQILASAGFAGAVDNAVGQFVTHHIRSLQLAARGGQGSAGEAILEHGLALHFLEDAFSAGHLIMNDALWARGVTHVRHRHDFFDAKGLQVRRALAVEPCPALEQSFETEGGLLPCWNTTGDGHLGVTADTSDRLHVARAVRKTELELAIAFDPDRVVHSVERLSEREQIAVGEMLDPMPWWTLTRNARRKRPTSAKHAMALLASAASAVAELRTGLLTPPVSVGKLVQGPLLESKMIEAASEPCVADAAEEGKDEEDRDTRCGPGKRLRVGTVGASLLRPILVELPAAEAELSSLEGQAMTDHGMAVQLNANIGGLALFPPRSPVDLFGPSLGASLGLAYRFGTYLPGRQNRSVVELNLGIGVALHGNTQRGAGGHPSIAILEQELRWPILWELLTSYVRPFDIRESLSAGRFSLLGGMRVREMFGQPVLRLWSIEAETAAIEILRGTGAYPLYGGSVELRFHLGLANPNLAQPSFPSSWGPTFGITLSSGYSTFL